MHMTAMQPPIIGIDLGTTNSVVAYVIDGQPQVFDCDGNPFLPSVVGLSNDGKLLTGVVARNQLAAFPDRTIASVKRKMGSMESLSLGAEEYTPPEISAMILRRLRDVASRAIGTDVTRAVITVPAYFDEGQRQATREAGELAGLSVERIINEPTAATLVYHAESRDQKHILVYDFGGGTFDVSVVRMESGVTEVLSSQGDTALGGDDLDQALLNHVAQQFHQEHGIDPRDNAHARYRLLHACEQAKIRLSEVESTELNEEFLVEKEGQLLNLKMSIDRATFNELIEPMIERTVECVSRALRDASMTIHQIDDLVLVGGSTRVTLVAEKLRERLLREPSRAVDPDLAVALGAAIQAAMLEGKDVGRVLVDVSAHTLGLEVLDQMTLSGPSTVFAPIIHRNSPLPARHEEAFSKVTESQETAEIHVLQGEHRDPERNTTIGKLSLNVASTDKQSLKIVVGFDLTLDGILRVTAKHPSTGRLEELTIDNALTQFTATERERVSKRLGQLFDDSGELLDGDELPPPSEFHDDPPARRKFHASPVLAGPTAEGTPDAFPKATALLERAEQWSGKLTGEDADELESLRDRLIQAVAAGDSPTVEELTTDLDDLLFYVQ
jgi:molecular chaperone DnaK